MERGHQRGDVTRHQESVGKARGERLVHVDHIEPHRLQCAQGPRRSHRGDGDRRHRSIGRQRDRATGGHQIDPCRCSRGAVERGEHSDLMVRPGEGTSQSQHLALHATGPREAEGADQGDAECG